MPIVYIVYIHIIFLKKHAQQKKCFVIIVVLSFFFKKEIFKYVIGHIWVNLYCSWADFYFKYLESLSSLLYEIWNITKRTSRCTC